MILTLSAPVLYALELTFACNNNCRGCFTHSTAECSDPPLPLERWRTILDQIKPHAHLVKLTGGEPTLHTEFEEIAAYLGQLDVSFSVFTNGCWLDPEHMVAFLQTVPQLRGLLISLHGATSAAHEAFSGVQGSFERALSNIQLATQAGLHVTLSAVIHRKNLKQLEAVLALGGDLGADHIVFNRYLGPNDPTVEPDEAQLREAVRQIESWRQGGARVKFGNCIPQCFVESSSSGCLSGVAYCAIDPWGNMRPCSHSPILCGNLLQQSVEDAWQSAEMERWRQMIPAECHNCVEFPRCHGGCRAMAQEWGLNKDPLADVPLIDRQLPTEPTILYEDLRPIGVYQLRREGFGYVLMRGNRIVPVPHEAKIVLDACDGRTTLKRIESQFGQSALDLIGALWEKGVLLLQE